MTQTDVDEPATRSRAVGGVSAGTAEGVRATDREVGSQARSQTPGSPGRGTVARLADADKKLSCEVLDPGAAPPSRLFKAYFFTRSFELDGSDLIRLRELADLFVSSVDWNAVWRSGAAPVLQGSVTGHADCRPSMRPNNLELSQQRAFEVKAMLIHFVDELAEPLMRGGRIEDRITLEGEGTADCELDPDCHLANFEVLARYRRADLTIELPTKAAKWSGVELPAGVPEELREEARELIQKYPPLVEYIKEVGWELFLELLKDITFFEIFFIFVDFVKSFEAATKGRDFILEPFRFKGWAYGATAWTFGESDFEALKEMESVSSSDVCAPLVKELQRLREKDVAALRKKAIFKPYHVEEAQEIWKSALMEGCAFMQSVYTKHVPKQRISPSTHRMAQLLIRRVFMGDPKRMAKALYERAHTHGTMFVGPAQTELMRYLDASSYPD